jgi:hypothetical protein
MQRKTLVGIFVAIADLTAVALVAQTCPDPEWTVKISGGHETNPIDHGRPVSLVAGGLGVKPEVFREAFSHVHPAPAGQEPDPEQVRRNKDALLSALGKYGITNDRLDEVSNRYRYNASRGEMWPTKAASVAAMFKKGRLTGFKVVDGGFGYSSPPKITLVGHPEMKIEAIVEYSTDLDRNGRISEVRLGKQ